MPREARRAYPTEPEERGISIRTRTTAAALAVGAASIAIGTLAAGCGNGANDHLSKAEFLKKGNTICRRGTVELNAAGKKAFASPVHPTRQETIAFAEQTAVPNAQSQIDQLRDLAPPTADEARVKKFLDLAEVAVHNVKARPQLLGRENASETANSLAREYGLTACAG